MTNTPETRPAKTWLTLAAVTLSLTLLGPPTHATEVHTALKNGRFDRARALIEGGFNVASRGPQGDTALHWVSFHGKTDLAELLLSKGAKVNSKVRNGNTPLHLSAYSGEEQTLLLLLDAGAQINARNNEDVTPLHWAARNGHVRVLRILISRGADLSALDVAGRSAVDYAALREQDAAFELLRDRSGAGLKIGTGLGENNESEKIQPSGALTRQLGKADKPEPVESTTVEAAAPPPAPAQADQATPSASNQLASASASPTEQPPTPEPAATVPASKVPSNGKFATDRPLAWVQLAAVSNKNAASTTADAIAKKQAKILEDQTIETHLGELANGKAVYRVRIGPMPDPTARRLCTRLKKNKQSCFVSKATP